MRLPSGQVVWSRVSVAPGFREAGAAGLAQILTLDGFPETVAAIAESVRLGLRERPPREISVEFGIELYAKTGKILSVLAEAGGAASVKVVLTWDGTEPGQAGSLTTS